MGQSQGIKSFFSEKQRQSNLIRPASKTITVTYLVSVWNKTTRVKKRKAEKFLHTMILEYA